MEFKFKIFTPLLIIFLNSFQKGRVKNTHLVKSLKKESFYIEPPNNIHVTYYVENNILT